MRKSLFAIAAVLSFALPAGMDGARAQDDAVPYWVTLKVDRANMRVGPDRSYPISWLYVREGLPLKVVRKSGGWRLVEDQDGAQGWMLARFLSRDRGAVVIGNDNAALRAEPSASSKLLWQAEPGVIGKLGECDRNWCEFTVGQKRAWIPNSAIWGDGHP